MSQVRLARSLVQVPVSALCFHRTGDGRLLVLAGEDTHIKVYEASTGQLLYQFGVFAEQPIHGIDVLPDGRGLAWGAKCVGVFTLADGVEPDVVTGKAPDWVYHGCLVPSDASTAVVVTAHNEVVRLTIDPNARRIAVRGIISPARPILYIAQLALVDDDCVLVAAGTVFGEILVWKCRFTDGSYDMLFSLTGHEGSIFGVDISQILTLPGGGTVRLLASCSDDRTIRIWDITEREGPRQTYGADHFMAPRETGFSETLGKAKTESDAPVAIAMGHVSRIWGVKFGAGVLGGTSMPIYSFGEDSTTQMWDLVVDDNSTGGISGTLTHGNIYSLHDGKHLWARALSETSIATGGADSKVSLIQKPSGSGTVTFDVNDVCNDGGAPKKKKKSEAVGRFDFISRDEILVTTSTGRLLLGRFQGDNVHWERVCGDSSSGDESLGRWYTVKCIYEGAAVLTTTDSHVYFYRSGRVFRVTSIPGRIVDINCLTSPRHPGPSVDILVHTFDSLEPYYLSLNASSGAVEDQARVYGLHPRFNPVSVARVGDYLVMGSRFGYLSFIRRRGQDFTNVLDLPPVSQDAVTSIVSLPASKDDKAAGAHFMTTGRDGRYRIYGIEEAEDDSLAPRIHTRHDAAPPVGPLLAGAWFTDSPSPELVIYGFRSKTFIVWNETQREERVSIECGGGHRAISLHHSGDDTAPLRFAFTRASKLSIYTQERPRCSTLKRGTHGREVRVLSSSGRYVATGAEDTTIRIWGYPDETAPDGEMSCLAYIKMHTAGIQALRWVGDDRLISSAGNEEFMVWRVKSVASGYRGLGVVREAVFRDKSADGDLRIMDFDVRQDEEEDDALIITMAFSSSVFRTYRYMTDGGFSLLARGAYTGACLTQVRHLEGDLSVLTASTDGHICTWTTTKTEQGQRVFAVAQMVRVHQSSVKCLDMTTQGDMYCVLTGGDDNALGVTMLSRPAGGFRSQSLVRRAHAAAVNGVTVVKRHGDGGGGGGGGGIMAATVSNDQRIKTWGVEADGGVRLLGDTYSGVADAGDVEVVREQSGTSATTTTTTMMVAGVGVEIWRLGV